MLPKFLAVAAVGLCLLSACDSQQDVRTELPELNSAGSLRAEITRALQEVEKAQSGEPQDARQALDAAAQSLRWLAVYYVPLLEARDGVYNAYRLLRLGDRNGAEREISVASNMLTKMAETGEESLSKTLQEPLEALGEAKLAVAGDRSDAGPTLERAVYLLNALIVKGGLVAREE